MTIQEEHKWLATHWKDLEPFSGKWVAVLNGGVVASGNSFEDVWKRVKTNNMEKAPLVTYIFKPGEEQLIA